MQRSVLPIRPKTSQTVCRRRVKFWSEVRLEARRLIELAEPGDAPPDLYPLSELVLFGCPPLQRRD